MEEKFVNYFKIIFMFAPGINDNLTLYYPTNAQYIIVDKIKILKYLRVFQHVSDHRGSIIRKPCTVLGQKFVIFSQALYKAL